MEDYETYEFGGEPKVAKATVIPPNQRIRQLKEELGRLEEKKGGDIVNLFRNPHGIMNELSISERQAKNLRSLVVGGGTGTIHKYLSGQIGDIPASLIGSLLSSWIAKKIIS